MVYVGGCLLVHFVRTQNIQAHSSGEAEYYGKVSTAVEMLLVRRVFNWLGYPMRMELEGDSTAAEGIAQREGVGRIKQLELKTLWLQTFVGGSAGEHLCRISACDCTAPQ